MSDNVLIALITVIGVIFTAIVTIVGIRWNIWSTNVSNERMVWIKDFRKNFSVICTCVKLKNDYNLCDDCKIEPENLEHECTRCKGVNQFSLSNDDLFIEGNKSLFELYSRINTSSIRGNEYNFKFKELLTKMIKDDFELKEEEFKIFRELTNLILEDEWKKVKREAKGRMKL
ncbi:MAG: hypothetical protein R3Y64_10245 [Peptostreptococcaceae bacterium]